MDLGLVEPVAVLCRSRRQSEDMSESDVPKEYQGRVAANKDWREIVAWVGDLPPMPHVASRAIQMVERPQTTAEELTDLLSSDTALAARVLKIANSAMFCRQREITTLKQAIMIIGFKALKGIIVAATLRQLNKRYGKMERLIWENSMCSAMCAYQLATKLKKPYGDEIFLLGLLHSLGQIVFLSQEDLAGDYVKVFSMIRDESVDYVTAEQDIFGFAHPLIGALVAKKWNFSDETCQVILHYRDPIESGDFETLLEEKTAVVQLADLLSHAAGVGSPPGYPDVIEAAVEAAVHLGFDPASVADNITEIIADTRKRFEEESHVYG